MAEEVVDRAKLCVGSRLPWAAELEPSWESVLACWPAGRRCCVSFITRNSQPPVQGPRVLGIDDWAWRKGHRYGTILCDLETRRVIDLLPDRDANTVAAWLRQHPGTEIISRDRGGIYAEAARRAAPHAVQVADRWHLLRNLSEALGHALAPHHRLFSHPESGRVGRTGPKHRNSASRSLPGASANSWSRKRTDRDDKSDGSRCGSSSSRQELPIKNSPRAT